VTICSCSSFGLSSIPVPPRYAALDSMWLIASCSCFSRRNARCEDSSGSPEARDWPSARFVYAFWNFSTCWRSRRTSRRS
jgi:hypothetical protein